MSKARALLGLSLKSMLSSFRFGGRRRKRAASGVGVLVLLALLALYLSGTYSFLLVVQLAPIGMAHLVILLMSVAAVVMGTLFTVFAAQGVVFGGRDNDLMLSLPVTAFSLMLSRTLALYVENLVFSVFIMVPAGVAYLVGGGGGGAAFFLVLLLCTLLLAMLPTLLALVLGFAAAWVAGKFTRRGGVMTVLYLGFFAAVMVLSFRISYAINDVAAFAMGLQDAFSGWGLPFVLTMEAACQGNVLSLLALAALCVVPLLLAVWLFGRRYKKLVTGMTAHRTRSDYRLGRLSASGCRAALLKKEARRFFGSPIYFMNTGIGLLLLLVGSAAALVFRGTVTQVLADMEAAGAALPLVPVLAATACVMVAMSPTTAVSISLEGRQLWILKSAPISAGGVFAVKVGFQMLLTALTLLVSGALLAPAFSLGLTGLLLYWLVGLSMGLCIALLGLFINLCLPRLDAPNDAVVVKQSGSVLVTMLASFVLAAAGVGVWWLCRGPLGDEAALAAPAAAFLALAALAYLLLRFQGERMFREL